MKTIYKYNLKIADHQVINLPTGWEVISVQNQNDFLTMWAIIESDAEKTPVNIAIYGTGHYMRPGRHKYLGTVQMDNGLVWHVFIVD